MLINMFELILMIVNGSVEWGDIVYSINDLLDGSYSEDNVLIAWDCTRDGNKLCG